MSDSNQVKEIIPYQTKSGRVPFDKWVYDLRDKKTRRRIFRRIFRLQYGHYGDHRAVGDGVIELRFFFGAGYRVYFGEDGDKLVVLLIGGDKKSQSRDIQQAKAYWKDYLS